MKIPSRQLRAWMLLWAALLMGLESVFGSVLFSEFHFHPASEDDREEFIELQNTGSMAVSLAGWKLERGVDFVFPDVQIAPGGFLVIAADPSRFRELHPSVSEVVGGWGGRLSNTGEWLVLRNSAGVVENQVRYSDDADWGVRKLGPPDFGHRGLIWSSLADGGGRTMELRQPLLTNFPGQNWAPSIVPGGTPGVSNSVATANLPPMILEVVHGPTVPGSGQPVIVTARVLDEQPASNVRLFYRQDGETTFHILPMLDDGTAGDPVGVDGIFAAMIPGLPALSVVEYFVEARDAAGLVRTWPAPVDVDGNFAQSANALYQVDDSRDATLHPSLRIVMKAVDVAELRQINRGTPAIPFPGTDQTRSHAQFNASFVASDGRGWQVIHQAGVRNRGNGSRFRLPQSYRVNFPGISSWQGVGSVNLNGQYPHSQILGSALYRRAGMPAQITRAVVLKLNGVDQSSPLAPNFGIYACNEVVDGDFVDRNFSGDNSGNVYRGLRIDNDGGANLRYQGELAEPYRVNYFKETNQSLDDWSDLIRLTRSLGQTNSASYLADVSGVLDVSQWMLYFAIETVVDNKETNLANANNGTGDGDDYYLYAGLKDPRFRVIAHDLDSLLGLGDSVGVVEDGLFRMNTNPLIARLLAQEEVLKVYLETLDRLVSTLFVPEFFPQFVQQTLAGVAPQSVLDGIVKFGLGRAEFIRSRLRGGLVVKHGLQVVSGFAQTNEAFVNLEGTARLLGTTRVVVQGKPVQWSPAVGYWNAPGVPLNPGLNRILIQTLDLQGRETSSAILDVWRSGPADRTHSGVLSADSVWSAADGPHSVQGTFVVPAGKTLTVEGGASLFFEAGASLQVQGRFEAPGTSTNRIRFMRHPGGSGSWGNLQFLNPLVESRISHADFDSGGASGQVLLVDGGRVMFDHLTFTNVTSQYITLEDASFVISDSVFPSTSGVEPIHGHGIPASGRALFLRNVFGTTTGLNDIIDFTGGQRPQAILELRDNVFLGASDDVLDLDGTDAWIEGNVFMHTHQTVSTVDTSSAISGGKDGSVTSELMIVRNLFLDCDHMAMAKEGNFYTLLHNTALGMTKSGVQFDEPGRRVSDGVFPGLGAVFSNNILWQSPRNFEDVQVAHPQFGTTRLEVHRNILSRSDFLTNGTGNIRLDPLLVLPDTNQVHSGNIRQALAIGPGSPARRASADGLDLGASIGPGVHFVGLPEQRIAVDSAVVRVVAPGFEEYRYRLNDRDWSAPHPMDRPIELSGLTNGTYQLQAIARNWAGVWQSENEASISDSWMVERGSGTIRLNELLVVNHSAQVINGGFPDLVELYNSGGDAVDLSERGLTTDPSRPGLFRFPAGTILPAGGYLVLAGGSSKPEGGVLSLGFSLKSGGDGLYLYKLSQSVPVLEDSIRFGTQVPDFSLGRDRTGNWRLCIPTPGARNIPSDLSPASDLRINEWLASAGTSFSSDFVELKNMGHAPLDLSGISVTDNPQGNPRRFVFPDLSFVPGSGLVLLKAGGGSTAVRGELPFGLNEDFGEIALMNPDRSVLDHVLYGRQHPDVSMGRSPDGGALIVSLNTPTPGSSNPFKTTMTTVSNVIVTLLAITNVWSYEQSNQALSPIWKSVGYIDSAWPRGAGLLYHDDDPLGGPKSTQLNGSASTYYFRTRVNVPSELASAKFAASAVVDDGAVLYVNGVEAFRLGMAAGPVDHSTRASRTVGNAAVEGPIQISSNLFHAGDNILAVEVHQSSGTSSDVAFGLELQAFYSVTQQVAAATSVELSEVYAGPGVEPAWVEVRNPGSAVIDLSGLSFTDDTLQPARWIIPSGTLLPANGYLVFQFDGTRAVSSTNTGFGLKSSGGGVYLFDRAAEGGALLSSLRYGFQTRGYSMGLVGNGSSGWQLNVPTPGTTNVAAQMGSSSNVRVNEWMASPASGEDWLELYNPGSSPVDLGGFHLTDNLQNPTLSQLPALSFLGSGTNSFIKLDADGSPTSGAIHLNFKLSANGESIGLYSPAGVLIDSVTFGAQQAGVSNGRLPDGATTIVAFAGTATPGASNFQPPSIVINEVLAHTDPPQEDAIEIYNPTSTPQPVGGWFLSNSSNNLKKFRIPAGTVIPAQGYLVLYEFQFNGGEGSLDPFTFNAAHGDEAVLAAADALGNLTGFLAKTSFGASANGVSFGRVTTSTGVDFVPMSRTSFGNEDAVTIQQFRAGRGAANPGPLVGPVVISEIMYHPAGPDLTDNVADEYVELSNITAQQQLLYDPLASTNRWMLGGGIQFSFPAATVMEPNSHLVLVNFDPSTNSTSTAAFRGKFNIPDSVPLFGPYLGKLSNSEDTIFLYRPDPPQGPTRPDAGFVPYIIADQVHYLDVLPWPAEADGNGMALHKQSLPAHGNEPLNWVAAAPSPGRAFGSQQNPDTDGDGIPDAYETANGLNPNLASDAALDADSDGLTNLQEYRIGTDPGKAGSGLKFISINRDGDSLVLNLLVPGKREVWLQTAEAAGGAWTDLQSITAANEGAFEARISNASALRIFRLVVKGGS